MLADFENADFEKMSEIRARVDTIVADPATAERLKAWYRQLCKRPCFHDEYLAAFNLPSVRLSTPTAGEWSGSPPAGVVVAGVEYPVDCIIYASGFEVGTEPTRRYGFDMTGSDGTRLSDYWSGGMRSLHGIHVHGFPNAFLVQLGHGGNFLANVPHNLTDAAQDRRRRHLPHDQQPLRRRRRQQASRRRLDAAADPEPVMTSFLASCTPGYYNNEGQGASPYSLLVGYSRGAPAYFRYIEQWRSSGDFSGTGIQPPRACRPGPPGLRAR